LAEVLRASYFPLVAPRSWQFSLWLELDLRLEWQARFGLVGMNEMCCSLVQEAKKALSEVK
jgi:hypothetical protein